jgi:hypothetical protein
MRTCRHASDKLNKLYKHSTDLGSLTRAFGRQDSASYGFGVARLATTLLTITILSGWRSSGVVIAKFSAQVVAFRSSQTVLAETPVDWSALTRIRSGKPPRAKWSAATFFGLYRMMTSPNRQALAPPSPPAQQNYITCSGPHATAFGRGGSGGRGGGRAETVDEIGQPLRARPLTVRAKIRSSLH